MSAHTPGPWYVSGVTQVDQVPPSNGYPIPITTCDDYSKSRAEAVANARLIAAAPELLEALQHAWRWHDQLSAKDVAVMRAAIDKATQP